MFEGESCYAMNVNIEGKKLAEIPPDIVVLFETDFGIDSNGRQTLYQDRAWYKHIRGSKRRNTRFDSKDEPEKVYESRWNQHGGPELLTTENHKAKGSNILFNNFYVKFINKDQINTLKWE